MPPATGYSPSCAVKLHKILTTPIGSSAPQCLAGNLEERAVAYYEEYWDGIVGWDDISQGEEPYVDITHHGGAGTIVDVGLGGDEDSMDYIFDADGNLIFSFQNNQSPEWAWFCEGTVDPNVDPGDTCANEVAGNSDYRLEDSVEAEGTVVVSAAASLSPHLAAAVTEYAAESNLASDASVSYSAIEWHATYNDGADVSMSATGAEDLTYTVTGSAQWGITLTFRTDANGTDFVCKGL